MKFLAAAIGLVPLEREVGGEFAAELVQSREQGFAVGFPSDAQYSRVSDNDLDVVTLRKSICFQLAMLY